jgi:hypothetical protein
MNYGKQKKNSWMLETRASSIIRGRKVEDMGGQVLHQLKSCYLGIGKAFSAQHKASMINKRL